MIITILTCTLISYGVALLACLLMRLRFASFWWLPLFCGVFGYALGISIDTIDGDNDNILYIATIALTLLTFMVCSFLEREIN